MNKARLDGGYSNLNMTDGYLGVINNGNYAAGSEDPNLKGINKFGENENIDASGNFHDIWNCSLTATYTFSSSAAINRISSNATADNGLNIEIEGLDANYNIVTQTVTLAGTAKASLDTPLLRSYRMKNVASTTLTGTVWLYENVAATSGVPQTTTAIRAVIDGGQNQTEMAIYTVPAGFTAYMTNWHAGLSRNRDAVCDIHLLAREEGSVFQLKHTAVRAKNGTTDGQHFFKPYKRFPEKTDIVMRANSSVASTGVSAGFDIELRRN
jgi:hypothetical protein